MPHYFSQIDIHTFQGLRVKLGLCHRDTTHQTRVTTGTALAVSGGCYVWCKMFGEQNCETLGRMASIWTINISGGLPPYGVSFELHYAELAKQIVECCRLS